MISEQGRNIISFRGLNNDSKYAHHYSSDYQFRFNRRFDLAGMFSRLIRATAQTGKRLEGWLRLAEDQC